MMPPLLRFYVIERDTFIARDMCAGLLEACPEGEVLNLRHVEELARRLDEAAGLRRPVVVTSLALSIVRDSGVPELVARHDGRVVIRQGTATSDDVLAMGWLTLPSPFSTHDLADMVAEVMRQYETADPKAGHS